jgi:AcrR family transcriptional regulator
MNDTSDTHARLLAAALEVVTASGVAATTSRQIAAAAGTNLQAITYHFGSKDELVAQALVGAVRQWVEPALTTLRDLAEDPAGNLVLAAWGLQSVLTDALPRVPAYIEALALMPRSEQFRDQIRALLAELRATLAAALHELKDAGVLADWVDPESMAALVIAAADGAAIHLAIDPDGLDADDLLDQAVQLLLAASTLGSPPTPEDNASPP